MSTATTTTNPTKQAPRPPMRAPRGGRRVGLILGVLLLSGIGGAVAWSTGWWSVQKEAVYIGAVQTAPVRTGLLRVIVNDDGNVESARNIDLKCEVEGGSTILWIVPEGKEVVQGDLLVRLDASKIEEEITTQRIVYERAASDLIKAETDYDVASIAVKEYEDGTFVRDLQIAESNVVISRENLKSSENLFEHNERMFRKGYINRLQLETSHFAVERNKLELDSMLTARQVLVEYTKPKMMKELVAAREAAAANLSAMRAAAELEKSKLVRLEEQLTKCEIKAPQHGMVIYANEKSRYRESSMIEEGAAVREMQSIIQLPDLENMQVKSLIHETKIDKITAGMPATIRIRGNELQGRVTAINNQPEPGNWFSSDVKEYAAIVSIDSKPPGSVIKPGMTAEVQILVEEIPDARQVPLLGVVQEGAENVSYVKRGDNYERRPVTIGSASTSFIEIKDGLKKGEEVILNPRGCVAEAKSRAEQAVMRSQRQMRQQARQSQAKAADAKDEKDAPAAPVMQVEGKKSTKQSSRDLGGGGDGGSPSDRGASTDPKGPEGKAARETPTATAAGNG